MNSILTFQDIYNYKETPNILIYEDLIYEDLKIPCIAYSDNLDDDKCMIRFKISKVYLNDRLVKYIIENNNHIKISGQEFYVSDYTLHNSNVGEVETISFDLVSFKPFDIEHINLVDVVFK